LQIVPHVSLMEFLFVRYLTSLCFLCNLFQNNLCNICTCMSCGEMIFRKSAYPWTCLREYHYCFYHLSEGKAKLDCLEIWKMLLSLRTYSVNMYMNLGVCKTKQKPKYPIIIILLINEDYINQNKLSLGQMLFNMSHTKSYSVFGPHWLWRRLQNQETGLLRVWPVNRRCFLHLGI
jgi:hypothetical protein